MRFLNYLVMLTKSEFLSDLNYLSITQKQADSILKLDDFMFTKSDYQLAAKYLLNDYCKDKSIKQTKQAIVDYLLTKKHSKSESD